MEKLKFLKIKCLRLPYSHSDRNVFMFEDIEGKTYDQFVDACLPTGSVIMNNLDLEKVESFKKLNKLLLEKEDVSLDLFTEMEVLNFKKTMDEMNTSLKVNNAMNKSWGIDKNLKEKRDNFGLVNNRILDGLLEFYGSYPLFNNQLDSVTERIKWLESKPDNGELYYITLTNKINEAFLESKDAKIQSLTRFVENMKEKLTKIKEEFRSWFP